MGTPGRERGVDQRAPERRAAAEHTTNYETVVNKTAVTNGAWTQLTGTYTLANDADYFTVDVETSSGTQSFHIDDFTMSYVPATRIQTEIPALKAALAGDFPIGAASGLAQTLGERSRLLSKHFSQITPGNAIKWDATEPTEGTFRYTDADAMVSYAKANGMRVRGHTFVWHNQTPGLGVPGCQRQCDDGDGREQGTPADPAGEPHPGGRRARWLRCVRLGCRQRGHR